jgi:hypothetical protein
MRRNISKLIVLGGLTALVLVLTACGGGKQTGTFKAETMPSVPTWGWRKAQDYLLQHHSTSDGKNFDFVICEPRVASERFICWETDEVKREFKVRVRPVSAYRAKVIVLSCDNSKSDWRCP